MAEFPVERSSVSPRFSGAVLVMATLLISVCGLVYELLAGTLSSYLLGDSTTQFSLVIGWFLSCMGIGSWLSRFIKSHQLTWLIAIEVIVGLIGGHLGLIGFASFTFTELYQPILLGATGLIGVFVGLEVPLIICIFKNIDDLKITLANVMSADYIGALVASLLFPFLLVPHLGLNQSGLVAGAANVLIAGILTYIFRRDLKQHYKWLVTGCLASFLVLVTNSIFSDQAINMMEDRLYQDAIVYTENSKYQRIVLTRWKDDTRLYLNGHLQFSSVDEYRYHETLVQLPIHLARNCKSVLILGGGDGLAVREALKHTAVETVTLVDLDPAVTGLFKANPLLRKLNNNALTNSRVKIINADAMTFLSNTSAFYDVIIADLPDPSESGLAKLYSKTFYGLAMRHLSVDGCFITQSASPFRSRKAFWCIHNSIKALSDEQSIFVKPVQVTIPTFGTWGFNVATKRPMPSRFPKLKVPCKFLKDGFVDTLFQFPIDMGHLKTKVNSLNDPVIVKYYRAGYNQYLN